MKGGLLFGGLEEIRTPDPHNANVVRSQLRYEPKCYSQNYTTCRKFVKVLILCIQYLSPYFLRRM